MYQSRPQSSSARDCQQEKSSLRAESDCVSTGVEIAHLLIRDLKIRGRGQLGARDLTWSFFASSQNIDSPESFILLFFTRKVSIVIFLSEGGYALCWSQNDKTSNIWYVVFSTTTFARKLVVEWRRLPRFPAKMTLVRVRAYYLGLRKSLTRLAVVLVLESEALY